MYIYVSSIYIYIYFKNFGSSLITDSCVVIQITDKLPIPTCLNLASIATMQVYKSHSKWKTQIRKYVIWECICFKL